MTREAAMVERVEGQEGLKLREGFSLVEVVVTMVIVAVVVLLPAAGAYMFVRPF
jgi:prepilin-type N-terminal cleavage/methylation domain-containing protein